MQNSSGLRNSGRSSIRWRREIAAASGTRICSSAAMVPRLSVHQTSRLEVPCFATLARYVLLAMSLQPHRPAQLQVVGGPHKSHRPCEDAPATSHASALRREKPAHLLQVILRSWEGTGELLVDQERPV